MQCNNAAIYILYAHFSCVGCELSRCIYFIYLVCVRVCVCVRACVCACLFVIYILCVYLMTA